jgi:hypothetical protein
MHHPEMVFVIQRIILERPEIVPEHPLDAAVECNQIRPRQHQGLLVSQHAAILRLQGRHNHRPLHVAVQIKHRRSRPDIIPLNRLQQRNKSILRL